MQQQPKPEYQQFLSLMATINKKLKEKIVQERWVHILSNWGDVFGDEPPFGDYFTTTTTTIPTPKPSPNP